MSVSTPAETVAHDGSAPPQHLAGLEAAIDGLRAAGRDFWRRGWSLGTSSNYSVVVGRDPLTLLVTASGMDKGNLTRADFVLVGEDGRPTGDHQPKSSAETMLHVVLARRPDVGAVLHTHSVWGTLLSDRCFADGGLEIAGFEMLKGLAGVTTHEHAEWVPIFENTQDISALAADVERRLEEPCCAGAHGFLIRRHGLYTWGSDLAEARRQIEIFEFLMECVARQRGVRL